ncbi:hypothetical protein BDY19DRAFT_135108 [Irpex rosettiformis]|uniref:Uncharacterized protein n=1 Tax=Irpex rosettiformis TaxID=378272 RepID=A0ACB8U575_9APHY|nr:hypothetical protein BDY19DRAFT_135108 [Irpex rosettiformis]
MRNRYPYNTHPATSPPPTDYLALTKLYVQTARELGHPSLINTIIDRVTDTSNLDISQTQDCARTVMVPLAAFLGSSNSGSGLPSRFGHLQQEGLKLYLDWLSTHSDELTEDRAVSLLDAALACGNADVFMKSVWPRLEGINLTGTGLRLLAQHLASRRDKLVFSQGAAGPSVQSIIDTLAKRATLGSCVSVASVSDIMATLHWCTKIMCAPNLCNGVIERLLSPSVIKGNYIARVLVPLLPELKNWGIQNKQNVDYAVQKIVGLWVKRVLGGALPAKTLAKSNQVAALAGKWTCECVPCSSARTFLVESDQKRVILRDIGVPAREHVEAFLSTHADGLATCDKLNKSPQSLQIIKSDALNRIASWRANQEKGVALLKSLSTDENELRTILGPEYARVKAALAGQAAAPPATTPRMGANSSMPSASGSTKAGPPSKKRKYMT